MPVTRLDPLASAKLLGASVFVFVATSMLSPGHAPRALGVGGFAGSSLLAFAGAAVGVRSAGAQKKGLPVLGIVLTTLLNVALGLFAAMLALLVATWS